MSIKIKIAGEDAGESEKIPQATVKLDIRRTLDGNLIVQDHPYIDIIINSKSSKFLVLSKIAMDDRTYYTQNKFFDFLYKRGVIDPGTIQAGNIYSSMECVIPQKMDKGPDPVEVLLLSIHLFLELEKPSFEYEERLKQSQDEEIVNPDTENSTELGEVPHNARKGSMSASDFSQHYALSYLGEQKNKR